MRLAKAGRLNDDEASDRYGTNVIPLRMSREQLRDGFIDVMQKSYAADAYFERLDAPKRTSSDRRDGLNTPGGDRLRGQKKALH